ncbi:hypothetical protein M422DRAFT_22980, partial [Sphaerobolus stellatus SS14]
TWVHAPFPSSYKPTHILIDALCPICLVAFRAHLAEEEMASVMESPAQDPADLGVTRLDDTCKQ